MAGLLAAAAESVRVGVEVVGDGVDDVAVPPGARVGEDLHAVLRLLPPVVLRVRGVPVGARLKVVNGAKVVLVPVVEHAAEAVDVAALGEFDEGHAAIPGLLDAAASSPGIPALAARLAAFDAMALSTADDVLPLGVARAETLAVVVQAGGAPEDILPAGGNLNDAACGDAADDIRVVVPSGRVVTHDVGVGGEVPVASVRAVVSAHGEIAIVRSTATCDGVTAAFQLDLGREGKGRKKGEGGVSVHVRKESSRAASYGFVRVRASSHSHSHSLTSQLHSFPQSPLVTSTLKHALVKQTYSTPSLPSGSLAVSLTCPVLSLTTNSASFHPSPQLSCKRTL